ncbi:MAG: tetratricopeptide repeat protein, partial [bacterium]
MSTRRWWLSAVFLTRRLLVLGVVVLVSGCASAFRQGEQSARAGDWDTAIAYYERALQDDPDRPDYRIALERATLAASRAHIDLGRAFEERQELGSAVREYRLAAEFDPSNSEVAGTSLPTFGSRKVVTRLRLRDGESNLLAGLLREEDRRTLRGLPGALRVPLLQSLFGDNDEAIRK